MPANDEQDHQQCQECKKLFVTHNYLVKHYQNKHPGVQPPTSSQKSTPRNQTQQQNPNNQEAEALIKLAEQKKQQDKMMQAMQKEIKQQITSNLGQLDKEMSAITQ